MCFGCNGPRKHTTTKPQLPWRLFRRVWAFFRLVSKKSERRSIARAFLSNVRETNAQMARLTGRDLPTGVLLDEAKVVYRKLYSGRKTNLGSVAILLALDMRKAVVCMCLHIYPQQIGKEVMKVLNAKADSETEVPPPRRTAGLA